MNNIELKFLGESDGTTSILSAADDGIAVNRLVEQRVQTDSTYEERQLRFHESYRDFIERPDFTRQYRFRQMLATAGRNATESLSTSDMPLLFADTMNRELLGSWSTVALPDFRPYVAIGKHRDLFNKTYYGLEAATKALDPVNELGEYKMRNLRESEWSYKIRKWGNTFGFSFEFFLNRDTEIFTRTLRSLAVGARRRDYRIVTELFVDANGPHASFYKSTYTGPNNFTTNIIPGNPAFGPVGFEAGMALLNTQVDEDGEPIIIEMVHLVIPPALEPRAKIMFTADNWEVTLDGQKSTIPNPYRGRVQVHINPYIPLVAKTSNGNTSWFLFADPNNGRPALEFGQLSGYEEPQLFIQSPDQQRVGGGANVFDGNFQNDSLMNKVRHFAGGARFEPRATVASNGSGS